MKIGSRLLGVEELMVQLTKASKIVKESTRRHARIFAREVMEGSKERAPIESGELIDSHKMIIEGGQGYTTSITVTVGPVFDEKGEEYSFKMHEGFSTSNFPYLLGPLSAAKNLGRPHYGDGVGYKFLDRAWNATLRQARARIAEGVWEDLQLGMLSR